MKKKKLVISLAVGIAVLALGGIAAGLSLAKPAPVAVSAEDVSNNTADTVIFFDCTKVKNTWGDDSGWPNATNMYLRYWTGSGNGAFKAMTRIGSTNFYYGRLNDVGMKNNGGFCIRNTNTGQEDSHETTWVSWSWWTSTNSNMFTTNGQNDSSANYRAKCDLSSLGDPSSTYGGSVTYTAPAGSTYETKRLWVYGDEVTWWHSDSCRTAIKAWNGASLLGIYKTTAVANAADSRNYYFADVPVGVTKTEIVRLHPTIDAWYNASADFTGETVNNILWLYNENGVKLSGTGALSTMSPAMGAKVVEGYTTCSTGVNGYSSYSALNSNFISKCTNATQLRALTIDDYDGSDFTSYSGTMSRDTTYTVGAKLDLMSEKYEASQAANVINPMTDTSASTTALIATAVSGAAAAVGIVFLRKRKAI